MRPYVDLFFMGAAFLLLETKNVVQFALLFGTTWFVNALVFAGVLLTRSGRDRALAAVTFRPAAELLYVVLLGVARGGGRRAGELAPRRCRRYRASASRSSIAFVPIFFANLIFSQRFKDVASSTTAFGANLLGRDGRWRLEYLALVTGYRVCS